MAQSALYVAAGFLLIGSSLVAGHRLQIALERHTRLRLPRDAGAWLGLAAGFLSVYAAL